MSEEDNCPPPSWCTDGKAADRDNLRNRSTPTHDYPAVHSQTLSHGGAFIYNFYNERYARVTSSVFQEGFQDSQAVTVGR